MGCGKKRDNRVAGEDIFNSRDCVCDVVRAIADAQDDVRDDLCDVSCGRSINNLLAPVSRNNLDTVPFILYGKDLKPFRAFGADIEGMGNDAEFDCTESFIFRVNEVDDDECCAVLELLTFDRRQPDGPGNQQGARRDDDPCEQIDGEEVNDLRRTGICITVDLECFCAITCLPAVSVL
ncbi:CotY/CotZ family spore coat protein [Salinibacillus xinjiangensis]|uniref:Spore coat protein n=1 Tax=Salinibacillus xinjiangensis TaxID=1229268 RepID=A0A6G1X3Q0_9BACI|nr:CotY/CotZ family spore coat protein [Salinibacillus xinjiangensis]MRG85623.1 spore coat protein [Salinibacillus xinjiangensis]